MRNSDFLWLSDIHNSFLSITTLPWSLVILFNIIMVFLIDYFVVLFVKNVKFLSKNSIFFITDGGFHDMGVLFNHVDSKFRNF